MTADGQQVMRTRRRRKTPESTQQDESQYSKEIAAMNAMPTQFADSSADEVATFLQMEAEAESLARIGRECPVPKPRGIVGQLLGFSNTNNTDTTANRQQEQSKPNIAVHDNGS
jgi:cytochrome c oxidase assembly factor 2